MKTFVGIGTDHFDSSLSPRHGGIDFILENGVEMQNLVSAKKKIVYDVVGDI